MERRAAIIFGFAQGTDRSAAVFLAIVVECGF